jgi:hypothetical protein
MLRYRQAGRTIIVQRPSFLSDFDSSHPTTAMRNLKTRLPTEPRRRPWRIQFATVLVLLTAASCRSSDGLDRQAVSGVVTCDGVPLSSGAILFEPETQESGTAVGATIRQGNFAISRSEGPVPGSYRVRIYASSGVQAEPTKRQSDRSPRPMVEFLPARYNGGTELRAAVRARQANRYRFDLNAGAAVGRG